VAAKQDAALAAAAAWRLAAAKNERQKYWRGDKQTTGIEAAWRNGVMLKINGVIRGA
jgi:hypothetical protein